MGGLPVDIRIFWGLAEMSLVFAGCMKILH